MNLPRAVLAAGHSLVEGRNVLPRRPIAAALASSRTYQSATQCETSRQAPEAPASQ